MTTTPNAPPAPPAAASSSAPPAAAPAADEAPPRDVAGILLDCAGVAAACVLLWIIADVWTEGKLSGWWRARREARSTPGSGSDD